LIQNETENDKIEIVCKEEGWNENWEHKMHEEDLCHPNNQINQGRFRSVITVITLQFDRYLFPVLVMIIPLNKTTSYYRFDMNEDERMSAITINAISGISFFAVKNYDIFFKPRFFRKLSGTANFLFHILKEHIRFHIWQWVWEESVTRIRKKIQKKSKWEGDSIIFHSTV
jgi:hypothetical protein